MAIPSYQDIVALLKKGLTVEAQEKIVGCGGQCRITHTNIPNPVVRTRA